MSLIMYIIVLIFLPIFLINDCISSTHNRNPRHSLWDSLAYGIETGEAVANTFSSTLLQDIQNKSIFGIHNNEIVGLQLQKNDSLLHPLYFSITIKLRARLALNIDFIYDKNLIYWSDIDGNLFETTWISYLEKNPVNHVLKLKNVDKFAVDWIYNQIYWYDRSINSLKVSNLNESDDQGSIVIKDLRTNLVNLVLDPIEGWIFWLGSLESQNLIMKAGLDGSNLASLTSAGFHSSAYTLTLNLLNKTIYWSEFDAIYSCDYNGNNKTKIQTFQKDQDIYVYFMSSVLKRWLIWTDNQRSAIQITNVDMEWFKFNISLPWRNQRFSSVKVVDQTLQPYGKNYCHDTEKMGIKCSHYCLRSPQINGIVNITCKCPFDMYLQQDNATCINLPSPLLSTTEDIREYTEYTYNYD